MDYIILLFGAAIGLTGALLVIQPDLVMALLKKHADSLWLHITAVVFRFILGVALVLSAAGSKFPLVIEVIGWLAITAALVLWSMGRTNFKAFMLWALSFTAAYSRIGGCLSLAFGVFLVYAVI